MCLFCSSRIILSNRKVMRSTYVILNLPVVTLKKEVKLILMTYFT